MAAIFEVPMFEVVYHGHETSDFCFAAWISYIDGCKQGFTYAQCACVMYNSHIFKMAAVFVAERDIQSVYEMEFKFNHVQHIVI